MYAMVCTRPDLAHAVSTVSRYMANPGREHWNAVKWIFRYLKGTTEHGILFSRQPRTNSVVGYVDADYAGEWMTGGLLQVMCLHYQEDLFVGNLHYNP